MINIIAISDKEMIALNTQYRKKGYNTDILTFPYFTNFEECSSEEVAGEILLSESKIQSQAKEKNISPEEEIQILLIHGLVHMMGYDHETEEEYKEMSQIEKALQEKMST